jgi:phosphatidylglycerophosphate synthase
MFDEAFRARFQPLARPLVRALAAAGATPNQITLATFALAGVAAIVVAAGLPVIGVGIWLLSRIGDGLDGALARVTGKTSTFGGFLDITLDMAAYSAMVVGFAWLYPQFTVGWTLVLTGYVLAITTTLALSDAARAAARRVSGTDRTFQFTPGITEAGETSLAYVVWALWPDHLEWWLAIWVAALAATSLQRTHLAWRALR